MRIIFMGTPEFAVGSLDALVQNNFNVVAVVTAPDKPAGRGQQLQQSAVKKYATEKQIPVLQPVNLKDVVFLDELKSYAADLQIVVAFRMLPEAVWNMPPQGTFNLHASLLPKYRGAAPINWAIINGEQETGVTTFKLRHEIDTGNILFQQKVNIAADWVAGQLHDELMFVGSGLIVKTAQAIEKSVITGVDLDFKQQDDVAATHAPKIFKDDCKIDWSEDVKNIYNKIRGLSPYPTAYSILRREGEPDKNIKIYFGDIQLSEHTEPNGLLRTDGKSHLKVFAPSGYLQIQELQIEGKKRMNVAEFLKGNRNLDGASFV